MKHTAIYLFVDISKTLDGFIQPNIKKAIQLFCSHLDGFSFKEHINLYAIGLDRSPNPIVTPLNSQKDWLELLEWKTSPSAGLDLAGGLNSFIQDVQERSLQGVKPIMFLNERSGTPIYKYIKKLENMSDIVESFIIVACNETAKLHKKNFPDAMWIDLEEFLAGWQQIFSNWLSNFDGNEDDDVIVNVGFNPITSLQDIIDKNNVSEIQLFPSEFKGPIKIEKPLTLDGRGGTIWVPEGPGVQITSEGVNLKNLRIEVTGKTKSSDSPDGNCAIKIDPGIKVSFENILVRGTMCGLAIEEGNWDYPHTLDLGMLPSRMPSKGIVRLIVPTDMKIVSLIDGLELDCEILKPGLNEISIRIEEMLPNTLIAGTISLQTEHLERLIYVRGYVISEKGKKSKRIKTKVFWQPANLESTMSYNNKTLFEKLLYVIRNFNRRI